MSTFGDRLKSLRLNEDLTQEELGKIIGKSKNNVSQYETNKRQTDDETKLLLAKHFDVSVDYLLGNIDEPTPPSIISKDNGEVANDLNILLEKLNNEEDLMYNGEPVSDTMRDVLRSTLKHSMELASSLQNKDNKTSK